MPGLLLTRICTGNDVLQSDTDHQKPNNHFIPMIYWEETLIDGADALKTSHPAIEMKKMVARSRAQAHEIMEAVWLLQEWA